MCTPAALALPRPPSRSLEVSNTRPIGSSAGSSKLRVAGALGIEPRPSVLETDVLTVEHHAPLRTLHVKRSTLKRTLFHLFVGSVFAAKPAILATLQPLRIVLLVLHRGIIAPLAVGTGQCNDLSHAQPLEDPYARMAVTMPEPTVLPPSRIAKRSPWSIAIGEIRSAVIVTLCPGDTIPNPTRGADTPVTTGAPENTFGPAPVENGA